MADSNRGKIFRSKNKNHIGCMIQCSNIVLRDPRYAHLDAYTACFKDCAIQQSGIECLVLVDQKIIILSK